MTIESLTTPGTAGWVCPAHVHRVTVRMFGSGGGGLSLSIVDSYSGSGGGGGAYAEGLDLVVIPGHTYTYRVGGGNGVLTTIFTGETDYVEADYGRGPTDVFTGGVAGDAALCHGSTTLSGDTGNSGAAASGGIADGGTGGDAAPGGGVGGVGGAAGLPDGQPGAAPGGGGGGGSYGHGGGVGGVGGDGEIELEYTIVDPSTVRRSGLYDISPPLGALVRNSGLFDIAAPLGAVVRRSGEFTIAGASILVRRSGLYQIGDTAHVTKQSSGYYTIYAGFVVRGSGFYTIINTIDDRSVGSYAIRNDALIGYTVYVGVDALPDFTSPPTAFSATLPINIPVTAPLVGNKTLYVVVRKRNAYGLESQNQNPTLVLVNAGGLEVLSPLSPPSGVEVFPAVGNILRFMATYTGYGRDKDEATSWRIWIGTTQPDPTVDLFNYEFAILSGTIVKDLGASGDYPPGTYYLVVALYRLLDDSISYVRTQVTVPPRPTRPIPVPSGHQVPN